MATQKLKGMSKGSSMFTINAIDIYYTFFERKLIFQIIKINGSVIPQLSYKIC